MLVEQLYRGMPSVSRWGLKPLCLALAAGYIFELYLFADALLFSRIDADVWAARGIAHALLIPLIAIAGTRSPSWTLRMSVSREVVFHSTALAGAGLYLLVIAGAAYYVRYFGGDWGRALQMALLFAGLVLLGALLFSGAVRARLRVFISKHLFPYRYDYRDEWLRFTQALSSADRSLDLGQSVIKALSDLVESPGRSAVACRWLRQVQAALALQPPSRSMPSTAWTRRCAPFWPVEAGWSTSRSTGCSPDATRGSCCPSGSRVSTTPGWSFRCRPAERLIGFVVLSSPRTPFDIDWEVLDLLKTAQRQAAGYLDRMLAAEALLEARKFDSFNRMSAFVVHDLKNLVAQLSLMLKNAQRHRDNPGVPAGHAGDGGERRDAHARADDAAPGEALDRSAEGGGPAAGLLRTVCESEAWPVAGARTGPRECGAGRGQRATRSGWRESSVMSCKMHWMPRPRMVRCF